MSIDKMGSTANTAANNLMKQRKAPEADSKPVQPKDKFEPWIPNPKIDSVGDYFKNIGASVGNGAYGFGIMTAGTVITKTGADRKPKTKIGGFLKSALIVTTGVSGALVGAGVGLVMGVFGKNAGSILNAKHFEK